LAFSALEKYVLETIWLLGHYISVTWNVLFHGEFAPEFKTLPEKVQVELLARLKVVENFGPALGRPIVDTLKGSSFPNMKEIRFNQDGVWRFAFAFNRLSNAIVLCGGDKEGEDSDAFYKELIELADKRFASHIEAIKKVQSQR
jgi:hypothetical protein